MGVSTTAHIFTTINPFKIDKIKAHFTDATALRALAQNIFTPAKRNPIKYILRYVIEVPVLPIPIIVCFLHC